MRSKRGPIGLLVLTAALLAMALGATAALADTGDVIEQQYEEAPDRAKSGFQAGTCTEDLTWPNQCSPETPGIFFDRAGGNPNIGFTQYIVKHKTIIPNTLEETEAVPKTIRVDLPVGLTVNPQATDQCPLATFEANPAECPPSSKVGQEEVTVSVQIGGVIEFPPSSGEFLPKNAVLPPNPLLNTFVPIYNLVPKFGEAALFGFKIGTSNSEVFLEGDVDWAGDYHQGFTIKLPPPNPLVHTLRSRLVNFGKSGNGSYITNPTTCQDPDTGVYSTFLRADSVELPDPDFPIGQTPWEAKLPPGIEQVECDSIPFDPTIDVKPGTNVVDSPAAPEVTVELPFEPNAVDEEHQEQSHVRNAEVTFPDGMGLNPSAANNVEACSDSQFGKGTENPVTCPAGSKIGTAEVETPPLEPGSLEGDVYLAEQNSNDPESGEMYRIFINPVSDRYGIDVRLIGNVVADKDSGQLTARLLDNPQVPFESVKLKLDSSKDLMTSPPTCSPSTTNSRQEPWSTPDSTAFPSSTFTLGAAPNGDCPTTLADRRFAPFFAASPQGHQAGAFVPFALDLFRDDGDQEVKGINIKLPPGMVASLRGVEYCPESGIAAAESRTGKEEQSSASCPDSSLVGTAHIAAGSGGNPFQTTGNAYLAGPYKGAPVSLVFITPGVAGPFDLGNVVVRAALYLNPETVRVQAVSDPIPNVFGGVKLDIRAIRVSLDRPKFTLNPTTCRETFQIMSTVFGGGANPDNSLAWKDNNVNDPYQGRGCRKLGFKPKFYARIFGGKAQTRRAANPRFRAIYDARNGDANLRRAAFILPRATILDQSHIRTICTRVQLAADNCPKAAIYGSAVASSPLLDEPLRGPVYLTSSDNELPDLLANLKGQINVQLRGVISGKGGRLKTVFQRTPDVAVDKFILNMRGGNRGLLINSRNLCARQTTGFLNLLAQNSRRARNSNLQLNIPACRR